jgi:hypothetical protein
LDISSRRPDTIKLNKDWAIFGVWLATRTALATRPNMILEWSKITLASGDASSSGMIGSRDILFCSFLTRMNFNNVFKKLLSSVPNRKFNLLDLIN